MALIKCPECKHEISEFSNQCVYCGCPMTKIKSILEEEKRKTFLYANKLAGGDEKDEIIIRTIFDNLSKKIKGIFAYKNKNNLDICVRQKGDRVPLCWFSKDASNRLWFFYYTDPGVYECVYKIIPTLKNSNQIVETIAKIREKQFEKVNDERLLELRETYFYAIKNSNVEEIKITKIMKVNGRTRVYFSFRDGTSQFCSLTNIRNVLFKTYEQAKRKVDKYTGAIIKTSYVTSEFQKRNAFIIAVGDSYLSGFHAKQDWDTLRELYGKELGSFEDLNALDFTTDIKNAWLFGSFEGAADFARKIEHLCTPRIMKCEYTQKIHD